MTYSDNNQNKIKRMNKILLKLFLIRNYGNKELSTYPKTDWGKCNLFKKKTIDWNV